MALATGALTNLTLTPPEATATGISYRELIAKRLFARFTATPGFTTISRNYRHWTDVAPSEQPALFIRQVRQSNEQEKGIPTKWTFEFELAVYAHADNPDDVPTTIQNNLIDAVEYALRPDDWNTHCLTLGFTVSHCWINGAIETDEGLLGQQTVALIPITILATI